MERRLLLFFGLVWSTIGIGVDAYHQAFAPSDVLPLLPRSIVNNLLNPVDLLPKFVAAVSSRNDTVDWKGTCFYQNEAYMEYTEPKKEGDNGGGILHIKVSDLVQ